MNLNDLLRDKSIDPKQVLVFRHRPTESELNNVLPWLASKKPPGSSPGDQDQERNGLATSLPNLLRLERYERRALSRRDRALRLL